MKRKAVRRYRTPRYPAAKELRGAPQLPPPTLPERVASAALRAAAPLAIAATAAASTPSEASLPDTTTASPQDRITSAPQDRDTAAPQDVHVRTLTWEEIEALLGDLRVAAQQQAPEIRGMVEIEYEFLTEEEVRLLVEAFFAKNGIALSAPGAVGGIEADAWNADLRIGYEFAPAGGITEDQRRELELLKAQNEAAVLIIDQERFGYTPPGKRDVVATLHRELQRHLEWLAANGWVELE